jgi:hypothetical protein
MKSEWITQAAARNCDMYEPSNEAGETSKMRHENPTMVWAIATNQMCAGMFSMESSTLKNRGLKRALTWCPTPEHQPPVRLFRRNGVQHPISFLMIMEGQDERLHLVMANPHRVRRDLVEVREDIQDLRWGHHRSGALDERIAQ